MVKTQVGISRKSRLVTEYPSARNFRHFSLVVAESSKYSLASYCSCKLGPGITAILFPPRI